MMGMLAVMDWPDDGYRSRSVQVILGHQIFAILCVIRQCIVCQFWRNNLDERSRKLGLILMSLKTNHPKLNGIGHIAITVTYFLKHKNVKNDKSINCLCKLFCVKLIHIRYKTNVL